MMTSWTHKDSYCSTEHTDVERENKSKLQQFMCECIESIALLAVKASR